MRGKPYHFHDFRKGVARESDYLLDSPYLRDALNVIPTELGSLKTRPGAPALGSGFPPSGAYVRDGIGKLDLAGFYVIVALSDGTVRFIDVNGGTVDDITPAGYGASKQSMVQAPYPAGADLTAIYSMGAAGTGAWLWDTNTADAVAWTATAGTRPSGEYLLYHSDRMWVAGSGTSGLLTNDYRVHWSNPGDPRDWDPVAPKDSSFVDLEPRDGEALTGIGVVGNYVIVFKRRKCYVLYEPALATGNNRKLSDSVGCVAHDTISSTPYGTIFLAQDGPKITDGQTIRDVAPQLRELFKGMASANLLTEAHGVYHNDHYYLSGLPSTFPPILDWDIKRDAWWFHGLGANGTVRSRGMVSFKKGSGSTPALFVAGDGAQDNNYRGLYDFMQHETGAVAGDENVTTGSVVGVPWRVETAFHAFGQPNIQKRIRELRLDIDVGTAPLVTEMAFTPNASRSTLAEVIFEQVAGLPSERRYFTPGQGRACALRVSGPVASLSELFGYTLAADMRAD